MKIEIYDPPMCCSSGVCGTTVDKKLVEFASVLKTLSSSGVVVRRFNMSQEPQAFVANPNVKKLLAEKGQSALPFIFVDDELKWSGEIPSAAEILKTFKLDQKAQPNKKSSCCGGDGCC
ncbi:MAG: arsenite efflux transporter metallochaperone ArsD [Candidatus Omnitrophica bacterium]|nr:arsenite efflux transporter metallochaperone ArsD [Candidatus Omnitrophota bacterium]